MDEPKEMPTKSIFREVRDWFRARTRRELIAMGLGAALATFTTIVVVRRYRERKRRRDEMKGRRSKWSTNVTVTPSSSYAMSLSEGTRPSESFDSMRSEYKSQRSEKKKEHARPTPTVLPPMPPPPPDIPPEPFPTPITPQAPPEPVAPTRLIATTPPQRIRSLPPVPVAGGTKAIRLPGAPPVIKTSVPEKVHVDKGSISRPQPARRRNRSMSRTVSKEGVKTAQNVPSKEGMKTAQDMATARKDTSNLKTAREERKK